MMWMVLLLCVIASFADIIGGILTIFKKLNSKEMLIVSGLGTGFLLGATLLDRLPGSMSQLPSTAPLFITLGYLFLLALEKISSRGSISSANTNHSHSTFVLESDGTASQTAPLLNRNAAFLSFVGLLFHTFMDGVIIAGAFSINRSTGILIFFAITMHKIPEGFSMSTISLSAGSSRKRALLTSCGLAVSTMIGAIITMQLGTINQEFIKILMALATGTFLFVSTTDMVPPLKAQRSSGIVAIFIGVIIFYVSLLLIQHAGLS